MSILDIRYNKEYLFDAISALSASLEELETWSVYNKDMITDEVIELKKKTEEMIMGLNQMEELEKDNGYCSRCKGLDDESADCEYCNGTGKEPAK